MRRTNESQTPTRTARPNSLAEMTRSLVYARYTPPNDFALDAGDELGAFRIERALGRGGMGEVYEAFDHRTERFVALKLLSDDLDSEVQRERFVREGQLAARISHPNSVYVYSTEVIDGQPVILMELMPGGTLSDAVEANGPLTPKVAVDAILEVISGLDEAESHGVLHRDVKPANCLLDGSGKVKIGDYGLSIPTEATARRFTIDSTVLGTPAFASPEQLDGGAIDVRSDIYSVGATLYYLLTGRPPFQADSLMQLLNRVAKGKPTSPSKHQSGVPRDLSRVVLKCLDRNPARRFTSYAELRQALAPHSGVHFKTASLTQRLTAHAFDVLVYGPFTYVLQRLAQSGGDLTAPGPEWTSHTPILFVLVMIAFTAVFDGAFGQSSGKQLLRLRLLVDEENRSRLAAGALRSLVFFGPALIVAVLLDLGNLSRGPVSLLILPFCGLVNFLVARPGDGFRGLHDRISRSRVVRIAAVDSTVAHPDRPARRSLSDQAFQLGPYPLYDGRPAEGETIVLGLDPILQRDVWIRRRSQQPSPADELAFGTHRRLAVFRVDDIVNSIEDRASIWDVYEAPAGATVTSFAPDEMSWKQLRGPLIDVGAELAEQPEEARFHLSRFWIDSTGRGRLLAFTPPAEDTSASEATYDPIGLMTAAVEHLLTSRENGSRQLSRQLPLTVRNALEGLLDGEFETTEALLKQLSESTSTTTVSRAQVAGAIWGPGHIVATSLFFGPLLFGLTLGTQPGFLFRWAALILLLQCLLASFSAASALVLREGIFLRVNNLRLVNESGQPVSGARALLRSLLSHSPVWAGALVLAVYSRYQSNWAALKHRLESADQSALSAEGLAYGVSTLISPSMGSVALGLYLPGWVALELCLIAGVVYWYGHPNQGLQDRLAGTLVVPK